MKLPIANYQLSIINCTSRLAFPTLLAGVLLIIFGVSSARAMPEYAATTGEPCATCHVSPAGGGLRNVRGQAWVASDKPAVVPSTTEALKILGIQMPADMSIYTTSTSQPLPAPFDTQSTKYSLLITRLLRYEGN
jgi:mono/diheme cytochrome c family protein